jgi:hypothetical protein
MDMLLRSNNKQHFSHRSRQHATNAPITRLNSLVHPVLTVHLRLGIRQRNAHALNNGFG